MPGPPPNPNARRRNKRPDWQRLPATGRQGDPPPFPLTPDEDGDVLELWAELWATPQAIAWEAAGWNRVIARYALKALQAEQPRASAVLLGEVRQMEDRLGLSPMAMKRLQWEVHQDAAEDTGQEDADVARLDDYRSRLG